MNIPANENEDAIAILEATLPGMLERFKSALANGDDEMAAFIQEQYAATKADIEELRAEDTARRVAFARKRYGIER